MAEFEHQGYSTEDMKMATDRVKEQAQKIIETQYKDLSILGIFIVHIYRIWNIRIFLYSRKADITIFDTITNCSREYGIFL